MKDLEGGRGYVCREEYRFIIDEWISKFDKLATILGDFLCVIWLIFTTELCAVTKKKKNIYIVFGNV